MDMDFYGEQTLEPTELYQKDSKKAMFKPLLLVPKSEYGGELGAEIERLNNLLVERASQSDDKDVAVVPSSVVLQKVPSFDDLSDEIPEPNNTVPPLTPGTNQKMSQALAASFKSFEKEQHRLNIPKDPHKWSDVQVIQWLSWAIHEFSLEGVQVGRFAMSGQDLLQMGREAFLTRAPPFVGDILWEHLEILQKEVQQERVALANVPPNFSESVCASEFDQKFVIHNYPNAEHAPQNRCQQQLNAERNPSITEGHFGISESMQTLSGMNGESVLSNNSTSYHHNDDSDYHSLESNHGNNGYYDNQTEFYPNIPKKKKVPTATLR